MSQPPKAVMPVTANSKDEKPKPEKIATIPGILQDPSSRTYLPGARIGVGGFASCFVAKVLDNNTVPEAEECALKVVRANIDAEHIRNRFKIELQIHSKLHHANIVEFHRAFTFEDHTYIALELCSNGSLADMVKRRKWLTMGEIRRFTIQLCGAIKYLHQRDVVHRDIKAGNIFLDSHMNVKLGDFGLAALMEPDPNSTAAQISYNRRTTFCGTPNYLAPELLSRKTGHGKSVDIWATGVLMYYLAVGHAPFHCKSKEEIYVRLKKGEYKWPELSPSSPEIPEDLKDLVGSLLVEEVHRPAPDAIVCHDFFQGFIPEKLDALCRTRRPRFARLPPAVPTDGRPKHTKEYRELCKSSKIGLRAVQRDGRPRPVPTPVMFALEAEFEREIKLEIPLDPKVLYLRNWDEHDNVDSMVKSVKKLVSRVPSTDQPLTIRPNRKTPKVAVIYEDVIDAPQPIITLKPEEANIKAALGEMNGNKLATSAAAEKNKAFKRPPIRASVLSVGDTNRTSTPIKKLGDKTEAIVEVKPVPTVVAATGLMRAPSKRPRRAGVCYD